MHNCNETRELLIEHVLNGHGRQPDQALSSDFNRCAECHAEFEAFTETLRMTKRLAETSDLPDTYWRGYHARLRRKLVDASSDHSTRESAGKGWFVALIKSSIVVPVPVAAAVIITLVMVWFFTRTIEQQTSTSPAIVHVPVEVPVIQEKIVTRVVFRDRRPRPKSSRQAIDANLIFARSRKATTEDASASLLGFKPAGEIKLTVIKGDVHDEK